MYLEFDYKLI